MKILPPRLIKIGVLILKIVAVIWCLMLAYTVLTGGL